MIIRNAKKDDIEELVKLAQEMSDYHHDLDNYYKSSKSYKNLNEIVGDWFDDKETKIFVAEVNSKLVGWIRGSIVEAPAYVADKKLGHVNDAFVRSAHRKQKIGEQLFLNLMDWFREKKIKHIELSVAAQNQPAIKFWEKMGFETHKLRMRKSL